PRPPPDSRRRAQRQLAVLHARLPARPNPPLAAGQIVLAQWRMEAPGNNGGTDTLSALSEGQGLHGFRRQFPAQPEGCPQVSGRPRCVSLRRASGQPPARRCRGLELLQPRLARWSDSFQYGELERYL